MRVLNVHYSIQHSGGDTEWYRDQTTVVTGDETQFTLDKFRDFQLSRILHPESEGQDAVTVIGYKFIAADLVCENVEFICPQATFDSAVAHGIIEPVSDNEGGEPLDDEVEAQQPV